MENAILWTEDLYFSWKQQCEVKNYGFVYYKYACWLVVDYLDQGSSNLILEGRCPAEFSSNLPQHTCLEVSSIPVKSLISCFRCVWLGLELNSAGHRPSRTELGDPWFRCFYQNSHSDGTHWLQRTHYCCSDEETNSCTSWKTLGWVNLSKILFLDELAYSFNIRQFSVYLK